MASPSGTFQRPDLGLLFEQFDLMGDLGMIGLQVLPAFNTARQTANFSKIDLANLLQDADLTRASGGGYKRVDYQFGQDSFASIEYGTEEPIDDRERALYSYSFDLEMVAAQRARARVLRALEKRIATKLQDTATITQTAAAASAWSNVSVADPIGDVRTGLNQIRTGSGVDVEQCVLIMDWKTWRNLRDSEQIKQIVKYDSGNGSALTGKMSKAQVADALGVADIYVARAVKNTADKGQTASLSPIWDATKVTLAKIARTADLMEPCIGRTFAWTGDNATEAGVMEEYRDEPKRSQVLRCRNDTHEKVLFAASAYIISGC